MYCLKCKRVTGTLNKYTSFTRNGRILKGICKICGTIKNRFLASGGSLINKALNVLPLPDIHYDDILSAQAAEIALDQDTPAYEKQDAKTVNAIVATKSRFGL